MADDNIKNNLPAGDKNTDSKKSSPCVDDKKNEVIKNDLPADEKDSDSEKENSTADDKKHNISDEDLADDNKDDNEIEDKIPAENNDDEIPNNKPVNVERDTVKDAKKLNPNCRCKQKSNGNFYCYEFRQGRWVQASGVPYFTKEECEDDCCAE
jgi:hypothetical protein